MTSKATQTTNTKPAFDQQMHVFALGLAAFIAITLGWAYLKASGRPDALQAELTVMLAMVAGISLVFLGAALLVVEATTSTTTTQVEGDDVTQLDAAVEEPAKVAEALAKLFEAFSKLNGSKAALAVGALLIITSVAITNLGGGTANPEAPKPTPATPSAAATR